jgi:hypothetical protein
MLDRVGAFPRPVVAVPVGERQVHAVAVPDRRVVPPTFLLIVDRETVRRHPPLIDEYRHPLRPPDFRSFLDP